jgi:hypothetical protein
LDVFILKLIVLFCYLLDNLDYEDDEEDDEQIISNKKEFVPVVTERTARLNPYFKKEPIRAAGYFSRGIRPSFGPEHPPLLRHLIDTAWVTDPRLRPPMALIHLYIKDFFMSPENMVSSILSFILSFL